MLYELSGKFLHLSPSVGFRGNKLPIVHPLNRLQRNKTHKVVRSHGSRELRTLRSSWCIFHVHTFFELQAHVCPNLRRGTARFDFSRNISVIVAASDRSNAKSGSLPTTTQDAMPLGTAQLNASSSGATRAAETKSGKKRSSVALLLSGVPGPLLVLGVACLWGTNPIALRYLYKTDGPPSPSTVAAVQSTAAAALLAATAATSAWRRDTAHAFATATGSHDSSPREPLSPDQILQPPTERSQDAGDVAAGDVAADQRNSLVPDRSTSGSLIKRGSVDLSRSGPSAASRGSGTTLRPEGTGADAPRSSIDVECGGSAGLDTHVTDRLSFETLLNFTTTRLWLAGAELGTWAFLANALTVGGFQHTVAGRGAFLIRLSAIFTPMVAVIAGERVVPLVWAGCVAALAGGVIVGASSGAVGGNEIVGVGFGDLLLVGAAVMWSIQTVRLGKHTRHFAPLALAAAQMTGMAVLSDIWLTADVTAAIASGASASSVWEGFMDPLSWAVMLWPALGPWGAGTALQVVAQSTVSPSQTQVLLASDPLWAEVFARSVGGGEGDLGPLGWPGGGLIVAGAVVAGVAGSRDSAITRQEDRNRD